MMDSLERQLQGSRKGSEKMNELKQKMRTVLEDYMDLMHWAMTQERPLTRVEFMEQVEALRALHFLVSSLSKLDFLDPEEWPSSQ